MSDIESLKRVMLATREKAKGMKKARMESRLKPPMPPEVEPDPMDAAEAEEPSAETEMPMEQPEMSAEDALSEIKDLIARAGA